MGGPSICGAARPWRRPCMPPQGLVVAFIGREEDSLQRPDEMRCALREPAAPPSPTVPSAGDSRRKCCTLQLPPEGLGVRLASAGPFSSYPHHLSVSPRWPPGPALPQGAFTAAQASSSPFLPPTCTIRLPDPSGLSETWTPGGPGGHGEPMAQSGILEELNRAGRKSERSTAASESKRQHPGPHLRSRRPFCPRPGAAAARRQVVLMQRARSSREAQVFATATSKQGRDSLW